MDDTDAGGACVGRARITPVGSADQDGAGVRPVDAAEHLYEGRFARAVLAANRVNFAGRAIEAHALERPYARKRLRNVAHLQRQRTGGQSVPPPPPVSRAA